MWIERGKCRALLGLAVGWSQLLSGSLVRAQDVVVTGTRTPESSQAATVRTGSVSRDEAERRGAVTVADALSGELGVQVNPSSYDALGNPSAIQIQGFDRDRVLILEDGERVIGDIGGAVDLGSFPLTQVERIEYVTGPTSSLYGTSAIGGVVNIITGPPIFEGPSGRLRLERRSHNGLLGQASAAYRATDHWLVLDGSYQHQDAIRLRTDIRDTTQPEADRYLVGLRTGTRIDRLSLQVKARWIHDDLLGVQSQEFPGLGVFLADLPERTDRFGLRVLADYAFDGGSGWRLSVGRQWFDNQTRKDRRESSLDETRTRAHTLSSAESSFTWADGRERTWVLGVRGESEAFTQRLRRRELSPTGEVEATRLTEVPEQRLENAAVYGQLAWRPAKGVTIMPGARAEAHSRFGGVVAPRLAGAWRIDPKWTLRASGGRGFRAPSAKEYGFFFDHSFLGYRVLGNDELVPETSWGVNGDVRFRPQRGWLMRLGGFANWVENLIDTDLAEAQPGTGVQDFAYVNRGRARTAGAQIDSAWRHDNQLRTEVGYAYLWTRDDSTGRPLPNRPAHTVLSSLFWQLPVAEPFDGVGGPELMLRWRGVSQAEISRELDAPPFMTLDARLSQRVLPELQLYVGALNLLGAQRDPRRVGDQRPIPGRILYLGLVTAYPTE